MTSQKEIRQKVWQVRMAVGAPGCARVIDENGNELEIGKDFRLAFCQTVDAAERISALTQENAATEGAGCGVKW